jgi:valyl-tRNA synthetase
MGIIIRTWLYSEFFRARAMVVRQGFHQMATEAAQTDKKARHLAKSIL